MAEIRWWEAVTPHKDIAEGRVNEALYAVNLGQAVRGEGPDEYRDPALFFHKTYLTQGLRELLGSILARLSGDAEQNAVAILQTSFGGGKSHTELAVYHLFAHPSEAMGVPQVADLVRSAGLERPPACRVAVLPGTSLNPLGRETEDGLRIRTLWGEMAYQLGGAEAFALVADTDGRGVSPGDRTLIRVLEAVGPCVVLFDETLHYVDKVSAQSGPEKNLAPQTVAFLRELTDAVNAVPGCMMVVSLTASRGEQLSPQAMEWLASLNEHVIREAAKRTPIERTEVHEVVRQRLFEQVDEEAARSVAQSYRRLYAGLGGLPAQKTGVDYQQLMERSYPFHPELVSLLYERWGSKPGFQLTRDTLRFLAFALQNLWRRRHGLDADLLQCAHVDLSDSNLRGMVREVAGDPAWETVVGTDIAGRPGAQQGKAQLLDQKRNDGRRLAEGLAATILLYSLSGGENPYAARDELRLACARGDVPEALWDDILARFGREFFYYYFDDAKHRFRKEPNVLSLQHTYHANLQETEVDAYAEYIIENRALGANVPGLTLRVVFNPADSQKLDDDDELKLAVMHPRFTVQNGVPSPSTQAECLSLLEWHGRVHRQHRNTLVFAVVDAHEMALARRAVAEYLSWRKIQQTGEDWDRIGAAQQAVVQERLTNAEGASVKGLISAYRWALAPRQTDSGELALQAVQLSTYGPGKLIVPMVWERLTAEGSADQAILRSLTPDTLVRRYGSQAWPPEEVWVTTAKVWERFTELVGLPMLANRQVLLDTLALGQREGFWAVGHLADEASPRDERDSYLSLYFEDEALPPNVPMLGERWLLLSKSMYQQIANQPIQVTREEVMEAIRQLNGEEQPVRVEAVYNYVKKGKAAVDEPSFVESVGQVMREGSAVYKVAFDAPEVGAIPESLSDLMSGWVVIKVTPPPLPAGRTITVSGTLSKLDELGPLYKDVLQPLRSQNPDELTISLTVRAHYKTDPGAGLTASLADGLTKAKFPGLELRDDRKE